MVEGSVELLPEPAVIDERKTRGDEIRILASFPQSKPFWDDCAHKLECFTCDFQHKPNEEVVNRTNWMTKTIKKEGKNHTVAFCPKCTTGHPWIIHSETEYSLVRLNVTEDRKHTTLTQQKKLRTSENWKERPKEVPHYKDAWSIGDRYDKPLDWAQQCSEYDRKVMWHDKEKIVYDSFFAQKLEDLRLAKEQAAKKDEDRKEANRRKKLKEKLLAGDRFLKFASKRHPEHPAYANYILKKLKIQNHKMKHETPEEKHGFNSPTPAPKEKENIKN
jgi:hypothetical protein